MLDLSKDVHRRYNPLSGEWVLVSPHRTDRPWQGQIEETTAALLPDYDPDCYLCPGNGRAGGASNPIYKSTFVFENDFPAMRPGTQVQGIDRSGLLVASGEPGICRVVCFSPKHNLTLAGMEISDVREVIDVWAQQYTELGTLPIINSVQIFENRGGSMGASNPHPHCQIWANATIPSELEKELSFFASYHSEKKTCLLCDYLKLELDERERIVYENEGWTAVVPFWAVWPFEILVLGKHHATGMDKFDDSDRNSLAEILRHVTCGYDRLFDTPFPYTMGFHQRPTDGDDHEDFHMHGHFYPPLLRSAAVRKFMVGYEMLAMPQRYITP
jgi:UDPglucose--hexose-1-phosphate uridylyltransferase